MVALVIGGREACAAVAAVLTPHGFVVESAELPLHAPPRGCRVIIIDWDACDDGARACRAIAAEPTCEDATLLALSSAPTTERLMEILRAGVTDVFTLPAGADRLLARALQAGDSANVDTVAAHAQLYRRLFERNPLPMCIFDDRTLRFLAVSDGAVRQYGWTREEMLQMTLRDIRPPDLVTAFEEALRQESETVFHTTRHRRKDGSEFISQGVLQRLTTATGHVRFAVSRDVTEEVRLAESQQRSLADYHELVERTADGVFTHRPFPDGTIAYANPAFVAFLGYGTSDALVGRPVLEIVHPDDRVTVRDRIDVIVTTAQASPPRPIRFIGADGGERWAETRGIAVSYEGAPAVTVIARDLTERRRAEEALRRSEERFSQIFHTTPAAISIARTSDRRFVEVNQPFTELTGYRRDEVVGHTAVELKLWEDPRDRERVLEASRAPGGPRQVEVRTCDKAGGRHDVLMSAVPIVLNDEPHIVAIAVDISERKRLDDQLRHAHKMEAIGRLAGGIAHDFNNLLTGIRGYSDLLLQQLAAGSQARDAAQHILRASLRAASLTGQLLAFTRRQPTHATVLVLDDEVRQLASLLRRIIGGDVALELSLRAGAARVRVDAGQLEQVILNLAVNARDAMPKGGQLTITTAAANDDGRAVVRLGIADTGAGMTEEVRTRMFEPFYTTKEVGHGTGLGLSIVYGIVEQSGGTIRVESAPGRGSTFHITLPRVDDPVAVAAAVAAATAPHGDETVLLAEDDEDVRDFVQFVLTRAGYRVLVAEDGVRALELAETHTIDLLLSDIVMPRLNGHDLARNLAERKPRIKLLHMSGYPGIRGSEASPDTPFLQKPFSPEELLRAVRDALDRR